MSQKLIICDLNAIENRALGYLARCASILDVFRHTPEDGGDPYIAFGTKMPWDGVFKTYAELWHDYKILKNKKIRNWCKPAVLGGGYGLGGGEEYIDEHGDKQFGGLWGYARNMGIIITREFAHESVRVFRDTYSEVPVFWTDMEEGFKQVLKHGGTLTVGKISYDKWKKEWYPIESPYQNPFITFSKKMIKGHGPMVRMQLPSGRCLHYLNCNIQVEPFSYIDKKTGQKRTTDGEVIYYEGIEHSATVDESGARTKKQYKWGRVKTYGGKLTENAVQAFSRDLLLNGMFLADEMGFKIVAMVHDELVTVVPDDIFGLSLADLRQAMSESPSWASDLPLGADGFEDYFYHK